MTTRKQVKNKDNTETFLNSHKEKIQAIRQSNQALKDELDAERRQANIMNQQNEAKIKSLSSVGNTYARKIEIETKRLEDLEKAINQTQQLIKSRKTQMKETGNGDLHALQKKIKNQEYQLDQIKQKNNAAIAGNKILRAKIDGLRKERSMFDQIYKQLETELCKKKNELLKIIVEADKIKQQRQESHQKLLELKQKAQKEQRQFEIEYQSVFEMLEIEQQEQDFELQKELMNQQQRAKTGKKGETQAEKKTAEKKKKKKAPKKNRQRTPMMNNIINSNRDVNSLRQVQDEVEEYERIFAKLKADTKMQDIDEILAIFTTYEETNKNLYDEVNKLSNEEDTLKKEIATVKAEIQRIEANNLGVDVITKIDQKESQKVKDQKKRQILKLQEELSEAEKEQSLLSNKSDKIEKVMESLKDGIPKIFKSIGCDTPKYMESLLGNEEINEGNILQYMTVIERRTNEIIQMYDFCTNKLPKVGEPGESQKREQKPEKVMNEEITGILDDIEKELGYYKRDDQTDPFDVNLIEKQISRIMNKKEGDSKNDKKSGRKVLRKKTKYIY